VREKGKEIGAFFSGVRFRGKRSGAEMEKKKKKKSNSLFVD
jgi:hypothetical protein